MADPKPQFDTVYLTYQDEINVGKVNAAMEICSQIHMNLDVQRLYFLFSSNGGGVDAAITFYNYLKALPVKIAMHNVGSIDSAANVVFMAGDERYAVSDTSFLFHGVSYNFDGSFSKGQIMERLSIVEEAENKIANILASNSKITEPEVRDLFDHGTSKPAKFALDKGIVQKLIDANIPKDAPLYTINTSSAS